MEEDSPLMEKGAEKEPSTLRAFQSSAGVGICFRLAAASRSRKLDEDHTF